MQDIYQHHIDDFEVWEYPKITNGIDHEPVMDSEQSTVEPEVQGSEHVMQEPVLEHPEPVEHLSESIHEKINYLDAMGQQIAIKLAEIDATILPDVTALVKQTVKKIILKELSVDENIIKNMIEQSLEKINKDKAPCIIQVAGTDYAVFENAPCLEYVQISVDPALTPGSYIIKTKYSELQAILDDRLTVLFGL